MRGNFFVDELDAWFVGCGVCGCSECVSVEVFEGVPSVVDGFLVGQWPLRPRDTQDGGWVFEFWVVL